MKVLRKFGIEIPIKIPDDAFYITIKTNFNTEDFIN